jgi:hypothetical protein
LAHTGQPCPFPVPCLGLCPVFIGQLLLEPAVVRFQVEDHADALKVQPLLEQFGDSVQPGYVRLTVPAGSSAGTPGFEQAFLFIEPQILWPGSYQLSDHGDRIDAPWTSRYPAAWVSSPFPKPSLSFPL